MKRTRDEALVALDRGYRVFMDCLGQLTEEELTTTQVCGHWTVKDVVAHIWSWADEAVLTAKAWRDRRPWQEGVAFDDAWNEQQVTAHSALPLINVVDGLSVAHRRMMRVLDALDDEKLSLVDKAPWGEELALVDFFYGMSEHYVEHAMALRTYQEHCLEGC